MKLISGLKKLSFKNLLVDTLHFCLRVALSVGIFLLVAIVNIPSLAYILILFSKWRVVSLSASHIWHQLKLNAMDLIFSCAVIYFMHLADGSLGYQLLWLGIHLSWVLLIKILKGSNGYFVQGVIAQAMGVAALVYVLGQIPVALVLLGIWLVSYLASSHLLLGMSTRIYTAHLVYIWSLFSLQLAWILMHWRMNFWVIPRLVFIQTIIALALIILYILHEKNKLPPFIRRQIIISTLIIVSILLALSSIYRVTV